MAKVNIVKSKDASGCAIACLATILGTTYEKVKKDFYNDFDEDGITTELITEYLGDKGYNLILKTIPYHTDIDFGRKEMLTPFAPIHIVGLVRKIDAKIGHVVVMDSRGKTYCPSGTTDEETKGSYAITEVIGIFKPRAK
jgi:hypothetical protein